MPRRHKPLINKHVRPITNREAAKVRYSSKHAAERAAKEVERYNPDILLRPYQSLTDGAWYLTSAQSGSDANNFSG